MKRDNWEISQLTLPQKLDLLEAIWENLSQDENTLESPDWHEKILRDREKAVSDGRAAISDWEEAKERIRRKVS
ncbi:MAG: addiction module protein [Candidatus Latescibacterota bacterium]